MDDNFKLRAALKSDEELHNYVDNREKYLPESVEAAVAELQHRGVEFSDDELKVIAEDMQARRALASTPTGFDSLFNNSEKTKEVDDPDAPSYYTKRSIYVFSVLFSVFFGSIMLAINVNKTKNSSAVIGILLYGLAFTIVTALVGQNFHFNTGFAVVAGILGAYPLNYFFWNRYLGNDTLYRVKPIWVPLIIGLALSAIVIVLIFKYAPESLK